MRRLTITTVTPALAVVSGYGSRQLVEEFRGRAPMFSTAPRGWVTQPSSIPDIVALAELRGFDVVLEQAKDDE